VKARILVVDDDEALSEMIGIVLRNDGFEPTFCADGSQALEMFRSTRPDLVLLDLMLPGMDGIEVCQVIRAESDTPCPSPSSPPSWWPVSAPACVRVRRAPRRP
jgi:two-component system response regulator MtrA